MELGRNILPVKLPTAGSISHKASNVDKLSQILTVVMYLQSYSAWFLISMVLAKIPKEIIHKVNLNEQNTPDQLETVMSETTGRCHYISFVNYSR